MHSASNSTNHISEVLRDTCCICCRYMFTESPFPQTKLFNLYSCCVHILNSWRQFSVCGRIHRLYENIVLFLDPWDFGVIGGWYEPKSVCPVKFLVFFLFFGFLSRFWWGFLLSPAPPRLSFLFCLHLFSKQAVLYCMCDFRFGMWEIRCPCACSSTPFQGRH